MMTKSTKRGDTLIEVVISLAILSSILVFATTGALNAWRAQRLAGERTKATGLAQRQADALKAFRKSRDWGLFVDQTSGSMHMKIVGSAPNQSWRSDTGGPLLLTDGSGNPGVFNQLITRSTCLSTSSSCVFTVRVYWKSPVRPTSVADEEVSLVVQLGELN